MYVMADETEQAIFCVRGTSHATLCCHVFDACRATHVMNTAVWKRTVTKMKMKQWWNHIGTIFAAARRAPSNAVIIMFDKWVERIFLVCCCTVFLHEIAFVHVLDRAFVADIGIRRKCNPVTGIIFCALMVLSRYLFEDHFSLSMT